MRKSLKKELVVANDSFLFADMISRRENAFGVGAACEGNGTEPDGMPWVRLKASPESLAGRHLRAVSSPPIARWQAHIVYVTSLGPERMNFLRAFGQIIGGSKTSSGLKTQKEGVLVGF